MTRLLLIVSFVIQSVFYLNGQEQNLIAFDHFAWDFGKVKETDSELSHRFYFTNRSSKPMSVISVSATCNCTAPQYSKQIIPPGKRGSITVKMDLKGMSGYFEKQLGVTVFAEKEITTSIYVRGHVSARKKEVSDNYRYVIGRGLQLKDKVLRIGQVGQGTLKEITVGYINNSQSAITLQASVTEGNAIFRVTDSPLVIQPQKEGVITVKCDLRKTTAWALIPGKITFSVNGVSLPNTLSLSAMGVAGNLPEKRKTKTRIEPSLHNFGKVSPSSRKTVNAKLHNDGKNLLTVYAVQADSGMTTTLKPGIEIPSGKSVDFEVSVTYPTNTDTHRIVKSLYVVTNDSANMLKSLQLVGSIEK